MRRRVLGGGGGRSVTIGALVTMHALTCVPKRALQASNAGPSQVAARSQPVRVCRPLAQRNRFTGQSARDCDSDQRVRRPPSHAVQTPLPPLAATWQLHSGGRSQSPRRLALGCP